MFEARYCRNPPGHRCSPRLCILGNSVQGTSLVRRSKDPPELIHLPRVVEVHAGIPDVQMEPDMKLRIFGTPADCELDACLGAGAFPSRNSPSDYSAFSFLLLLPQ